MNLRISLALTVAVIGISLKAQHHNNSLGFRIEGNDPSNLGITLKHNLHKGTDLEGILHFYDGAIGISGLYEKVHSLSSSGTLNFYYGGGVHLAFYSKISAGIAGITGLCYTFHDIPFNISVDWKPVLDLVNDVNFRASLLGVSVRYTF